MHLKLQQLANFLDNFRIFFKKIEFPAVAELSKTALSTESLVMFLICLPYL